MAHEREFKRPRIYPEPTRMYRDLAPERGRTHTLDYIQRTTTNGLHGAIGSRRSAQAPPPATQSREDDRRSIHHHRLSPDHGSLASSTHTSAFYYHDHPHAQRSLVPARNGHAGHLPGLSALFQPRSAMASSRSPYHTTEAGRGSWSEASSGRSSATEDAGRRVVRPWPVAPTALYRSLSPVMVDSGAAVIKDQSTPVKGPRNGRRSDAGSVGDASPNGQSPVESGAGGRGRGGSNSSSSSGSVCGDEESSLGGPNGTKSSRYLREMDRRAILKRLANGEKQATLAKEYQVSRAAICNLNKHRDEVMSRSDENPLAKHPKKRKIRPVKTDTTDATDDGAVANGDASGKGSSKNQNSNTLPTGPTSASVSSTATASAVVTVHEVKSRAVQLLLTALREPTSPLDEFRRSSERLIRLVLEEALAIVPTRPVEVSLGDQMKVDGIGTVHPACAISLEQRHCPMIDMFHVLEPRQPTGYVRLDASGATPGTASMSPPSPLTTTAVNLLDAHLPQSLAGHNVFLLDVVAASGETMCAILQTLQRRGAIEAQVHIVTLFVSSEVVAMVQCKYPRVKLVTAQIDPGLQRRRGTAIDALLARLERAYDGDRRD